MNSQPDATITDFIDNYHQLNHFHLILVTKGSIAGALHHKL